MWWTHSRLFEKSCQSDRQACPAYANPEGHWWEYRGLGEHEKASECFYEHGYIVFVVLSSWRKVMFVWYKQTTFRVTWAMCRLVHIKDTVWPLNSHTLCKFLTCRFAKWCPMLHLKVAFEAPCSCIRLWHKICSRWHFAFLLKSLLRNVFISIITGHTVQC